jgi:preprotein translocase subunit SecA
MGFLESIFGSKNKRTLKKLQPRVEAIKGLRDSMQQKSDPELQQMTAELKQRLDNGASLDDILHEAFATIREAAWRVLKMEHFPVQLLGGMVLHQGTIAEMKTGEGKTLVATSPSYLNALSGKGVHVVTVNDYLARRDAEWMGQVHRFLGLSVGTIVHGIDDYARQKAYNCDITYGQNNEFGFDYLRDNMKMSPDRMVQRGLNYAIVDEVDSILIDEARTPLIISGPAEESAELYETIDKIIPRLKRDVDFTVDEKARAAMLTDQGVERVEKLLGLDNLYDPKNIAYVHRVGQALRAHSLYKRDVNYLIEGGKIVIIDEFTGRKMPGRRWSDGLHQAIEAKEGVKIEEENQTLASVTFQNYFRMYGKLGGMTGTADTEAAEFHQIYKLDVVCIPTNKPMLRQDEPDLVYKNEKGKFKAVFEEIVESYEHGQPVLVGTTSVEKSEVLASMLKKKGVKFEVLNAKQHEREAHVVAQAGRKGAITISTNMAGRGTDIVLGGNAEEMAKAVLAAEGRESEPGQYEALLAKFQEQCAAEREEVLAAGGLKIIGTERHESRRIDNQLRGRAGRQGDPGASRFYLSLEDDLLRIFGAERITGFMERLGMEEDVPIEHSWVTNAIERAQKKVEGQNFDSRKNVLEYDDVMNQQRKTIYGLRKQILEGRYEPELSEKELKQGVSPQVPTESGEWTYASLTEDLRPAIEELVDRAREEASQLAQGSGPGDEEVSEIESPPPWRKLRTTIWRQTGALCDIERRFDGDRDELIESILETVAASQVQQRERLCDLAETILGYVIDTHCPPGTHSDDWDFDALHEALREQFAIDAEVPRSAADQQELAEELWKPIEERISEREKELGRPFFLYFIRHFFLEEIDSQWIQHLKAMDQLREGIGLRGYGQRDPKREYKREGYELFQAMMQNIQSKAGEKIFRVQIQRKEDEVPAMEAKRREMQAIHPSADGKSSTYGDAADGGKQAASKKPVTVKRDRPKVGRNDPCPCGSGKKYKKCCGREAEAAAS